MSAPRGAALTPAPFPYHAPVAFKLHAGAISAARIGVGAVAARRALRSALALESTA